MAGFAESLNEQIAHEYAASQQYVAIAVHYDAESLPQLAAHFYRQAVEERNHAMMMVQFLLDADEAVDIPGVEAPKTDFGDAREPVALALEQEKRVTDQIVALVELAREEGKLVGEQFLHWFLQEQREEVASMSHLLATMERAGDNLLLVEEILARTGDAREPARGRRPSRRRRRALASHRVQAPLAGDALQLGCLALLELELRAGDEILDRSRHEHLPGTRRVRHAGADVHGDPADLAAHLLALTGVEARPDLEPERANRVDDRRGAADGARGPVEGGEETVAGRLDLRAAVR